MVRLAGVRKAYPGVGEVLAGVDLDLAAGRPVVIVGANGSGKVSALALYPAAAWFAVVVANAESPEQRPVTVASAGGFARVAVGTSLVAFGGGLAMAALPVLVPLVVPRYPYPGPVVLAGMFAHLACATAGTAIGLLCARPFVRRIGWSFCLGLTLVTITAVQPWLPPAGTAVRAIVASGPAPVGDAVVGLVLVVLVTAAGWAVERRR